MQSVPESGDWLNGISPHPRVDHLRALLGNDVLLLSWPKGVKGTKVQWGHLTAAKMAEPDYLRKLESGNIGVAQGDVSNGVCSVDWDDDEWMERFLALNPALAGTLRTKGARGCNFWVRCRGSYPSSFKIKTERTPEHPKGDEVGEWRANGNQTIISGQHPSGSAYSILVEAKPVVLEYQDIVWPEGVRVRRAENELPIAHSTLSLPAPAVPSVSQHPQASSVSQAGVVAVVLFAVAEFVPSERGHSDSALWVMAGRLKTWEKRSGRTATTAERMTLFKSWWAEAHRNLDPAMDYHAYLAKWIGVCKRRKYADDETPLTVAWEAAQKQPLPMEATADYDPPMSDKMRLLVALCYQLQIINGTEPFYLGSRDAEGLLSVPHRTVAYWLDLLSEADGPFHVLQKVRSGSLAVRRTNEWSYLRLAQSIDERPAQGATEGGEAIK